MSYVQRGEWLRPGENLTYMACHRVAVLREGGYYEVWHTVENKYILLGPGGHISLLPDVLAFLRHFNLPEDNLGQSSMFMLSVQFKDGMIIESVKEFSTLQDMIDFIFGEED